MAQSNKNRPTEWKIGSFTKNFAWGSAVGLKRLHDAIRIGFGHELAPIPRHEFRSRIESAGFIDYIPVNFFLYNMNIGGVDHIVVDELVYQAIKFPHSRDFDTLALFSLLLSEVGAWAGAEPGQDNPSEWARYFVIDHLRDLPAWTADAYSADEIERFLESRPEFQSNTRKLATNLSYFFKRGHLEEVPAPTLASWFSNAVFLALDRYYFKTRPEQPTVSWALDVLAENDVADIAGANEVVKIQAQSSLVQLFVEARADLRFVDAQASIVAVLSRSPALLKTLPDVTDKWLRHRLFVEIAHDKGQLDAILAEDLSKGLKEAVARLHNSLPSPSLSGDDVIALFRKRE